MEFIKMFFFGWQQQNFIPYYFHHSYSYLFFKKTGKLFPEFLPWTMNLVLLKAAWSGKFSIDTGIILQDYSDTFTAC